MTRIFSIAVCLSLPVLVHAQEGPVFRPLDDVPEIVSFFAPFILPKIVQDDFQLKEYVRSVEFARFRKRYGDVFSIDAVFHEALRLTWNNVYEALLISTLATMDHRRFGVRFPIVGGLLWVPLTSEFETEFNARVAALPTRLYPDTPDGRRGDRDKLQHFFGSALFGYVFESREAADRIGDFVEWGENLFIVGGTLDERDLRADRQGQEFGLALLADKSVQPSTFFKYCLAREPHETEAGCIPGLSIGMEER